MTPAVKEAIARIKGGTYRSQDADTLVAYLEQIEPAAPVHEVINIPAQKGLDPITVFLKDYEPGRGEITITCYGDAFGGSWTNFWGAMGKDRGIREFFLSCDNGYLLSKLGAPSEPLKATEARDYGITSKPELDRIREQHQNWRARNKYIIRIIEAVRVALAAPKAEV